MFQNQDLVLQGGHIRCPICGNSFDWSYKLQLIPNVATFATAVESKPYYFSHVATSDGHIRFVIPCGNCYCPIETEAMELINETNYKSHKS